MNSSRVCVTVIERSNTAKNINNTTQKLIAYVNFIIYVIKYLFRHAEAPRLN
jgi:hypothetical protein